MSYQHLLKLAEERVEGKKREITARGVIRDIAGGGAGSLAARVGGALTSRVGLKVLKDELERPGELSTGKALKEALESKKFLRPGSLPLDLSNVGKGKGGSFRRLSDTAAQNATGYRGSIHGKLTAGGTVLAHELGHATGRRLPPGLISTAWGVGRRGSGVAHMIPRAQLAFAQDEKDIDRASTLNNVAYGATMALHAPRLIEEARASMRANPLARKMIGRDINRKALMGAYATYLGASAVPTTIRYALNRSAIKTRRAEIAERGR